LGELGGESESILVLLFWGAVGNLAPLRRIKIHMGALATTEALIKKQTLKVKTET